MNINFNLISLVLAFYIIQSLGKVNIPHSNFTAIIFRIPLIIESKWQIYGIKVAYCVFQGFPILHYQDDTSVSLSSARLCKVIIAQEQEQYQSSRKREVLTKGVRSYVLIRFALREISFWRTRHFQCNCLQDNNEMMHRRNNRPTQVMNMLHYNTWWSWICRWKIRSIVVKFKYISVG